MEYNPCPRMIGNTLQIGLAGLGTVGTGVFETLNRNHDILEARAQISYAVRRIAVRDATRPRDTDVPRELLTEDWHDLTNDPDIDIIIELIGGTNEAYHLIKAALEAGKPVVTGNKALLARHGGELFRLSRSKGTPLYFEASVGGGIPIVQSLQHSLVCNRVQSVAGILNGTSNYVLTSMQQKGISFAEALKRAQEKGYAEADPSFDVNGWDAAHKALVLAMLAYGTLPPSECMTVSGIENVEAEDFRFADMLGYTIKLMAIIRHHAGYGQEPESLELRVQASLVPKEHMLAHVNGVFNAIAVRGDVVGETIFYGRGAGRQPTASAVIADVVLAMRECKLQGYHTGFLPYTKDIPVMPIQETETPCYVRFLVQDRPGVIACVSAAFAERGVGISAINSTTGAEDRFGVRWNHLVIMLHSCKWGDLRAAIAECTKRSFIHPYPVVLRIENFTN